MNICLFCDKKGDITIGVALGTGGWDYFFCKSCTKKKTIDELLKKIEEQHHGK